MAEDPHKDLHDQAAQKGEQHEPVELDDDDWKTALDKLNKTLTGRINNLRTDVDTFQTNVSGSVQALTGEVKSAKTKIQNNADAITAQDGLIEEAKTAAAGAKTAAAAAKQTADANATKIAATDQRLAALHQEHDQLVNAYSAHSHDVTFTFQGKTGGPKTEGNA